MEDRKIEYLKKHLEQALEDDNFNEVNSCYQELLKHVKVNDIPALAQKVNDYNKKQSDKADKKIGTSADDIKQRIREAKKKYNTTVKMMVIGLVGGGGVAVLAILLAFLLEEVFDMFLNDSVLVLAIAGGVLLLIGIVFAIPYGKYDRALTNCRREIFKLICDSEIRLKYLENVETRENKYVGQVQKDNAHGFGVGALPDGSVYIGEWEDNAKSGIGKIITDDMLMTLEGEFKDDKADGVVDILWEDGSEWHGEYKNGLPWTGKGKTFVKNKILEGIWKNGVKVS